MPGAPAAATTVRESDGQVVLQTTMGNWLSGPNAAAASYISTVIDPSKTYVTGGTGVDDVASSNQAMLVTFY